MESDSMTSQYKQIRHHDGDRLHIIWGNKDYYWAKRDFEPDRGTFLLMEAPASGDDRYYYVFNWEGQKGVADADRPLAWTIESDEEGARLVNRPFTGGRDQQFRFKLEDGEANKYRILSRRTGMCLYRSDNTYKGHKPIRQIEFRRGETPGSKYFFELMDYGPVSIPERDTTVNPPNPPEPTPPEDIFDVPVNPLPMKIGEALSPFYLVTRDDGAVGPLRYFQVSQQPYYVLIRSQQWRVTDQRTLGPNHTQTVTFTHESGMTETTARTMETTTGFKSSIDLSTTATLGVPDVGTVEATRAFHAEFSRQVVSTISEMTESVTRKSVEITDEYPSTPKGRQIVYWTLYDLWSVKGGKTGTETPSSDNPTIFNAVTSWPPVSSTIPISPAALGLVPED